MGFDYPISRNENAVGLLANDLRVLMRVHEQVYTSAAQLLEGGGNLGVVAESRGFPRPLGNSLASFRGYTMLPGLSPDMPGTHPPRLVIGPLTDGKTFGMTRTVFAGADHTGRTTPLTHHALISIADARGSSLTGADLIREALRLFVSSWSETPRWFEPPRELDGKGNGESVTGAAGDLIAIAPWIVDVMIRFANDGAAIVLVIRPDQARAVQDLVIGSLAMVPPSLQWAVTIATHAVTLSDFVREAAVLVSYEGSSLLAECRQRRDRRAPLIVNVTGEVVRPVKPLSAWGSFVKGCLPTDVDAVIGAARRFDSMNLRAEDLNGFAIAIALSSDLAKAPAEAASAEWRAFAPRFKEAGENAAIQEWLGRCATESLQILARDETSASKWETLSRVVIDPAWPAEARNAAMALLLDGGNDAIDAFHDAARPGSPEAKQARTIELAALASRPAIVTAAFNAAVAPAAKAIDVRRSAAILQSAIYPAESAASAIETLVQARPPVLNELEGPLFRSLSKGLRAPHQAKDLYRAGTNDSVRRKSVQLFVAPLLQEKLKRVQDLTWRDWMDAYREVAAKIGERASADLWLIQTFPQELRSSDVGAWLDEVTAEQAKSIRSAAESAGLIEPLAEVGAAEWVAGPATRARTRPHPLRDCPVDSGPPTPSPSAGPVRRGIALAVLVAGAGISTIAVPMLRPALSTVLNRSLIAGGLGVLALFIVAEGLMRTLVRTPKGIGYARWFRQIAVVLLFLSLCSVAWPAVRMSVPIVRSYLSGIHQK
jgi:hypothetical protein